MAVTDTISRADAIDLLKKWSDGCVYIDIKTESAIKDFQHLPSAERKVAHIQDFTKYQIDWLTEHNDLELEPELESWVIRFLKDTADCYDKEYLTSAERKGHWIKTEDGYYVCSLCKAEPNCCKGNYCMDCGARKDSRLEDIGAS